MLKTVSVRILRSSLLSIFVLPTLFFSSPSTAVALEGDFLSLTQEARIGHSKLGPHDVVNRTINSPKSVRFSADGRKIYINSLEGHTTQIYNWPELTPAQPKSRIHHVFDFRNQDLFQDESNYFDYPYFKQSASGNPNDFNGLPVESDLSHQGRFLWIPYYRRSYDPYAKSPSAIAIVDTHTDEIIRVMPTGPIPKFVVASPDGRHVAIVNWGDNTIGLIDTSSGDPRRFRYVSQLIVERRLPQSDVPDSSSPGRDEICGFCLRGSVFSPDSRVLFVSRMHRSGAGITAFDVETGRLLGTISNVPGTPRHLLIDPAGKSLFMSANASGYVVKLDLEKTVQAFRNANGGTVATSGLVQGSVHVGQGARTIGMSPHGDIIYAAVAGVPARKGSSHQSINGVMPQSGLGSPSMLVAIHASSMQVITALPIDPHAVGLAVAPDGSAVVLTSQGRNNGYGHVVNIVRVRRSGSDSLRVQARR